MDTANETVVKKEGCIDKFWKKYNSWTQAQQDFFSFGVLVPIVMNIICFFITLIAFSEHLVFVLLSYIAITALSFITNVCTNYFDKRRTLETKTIGYIIYVGLLVFAAVSSACVPYLSAVENKTTIIVVLIVFLLACIGAIFITKKRLEKLGTLTDSEEDNKHVS